MVLHETKGLNLTIATIFKKKSFRKFFGSMAHVVCAIGKGHQRIAVMLLASFGGF